MTDVLEGVTILSETTETPEPVWAMIGFIILGVLLFSLGIYVMIIVIRKKFDSSSDPYFPMFMALSVGLVLLVGGIYKQVNNTPYTVYKVSVDSSVSFVEFTEKYEVIKQDGLIYEVKERTNK